MVLRFRFLFPFLSVISSPKDICQPSVCRILDGGSYRSGRQEPVGCPGEPEGVRGEEDQSDIGGRHAFAHVGNVWLALFLHDRPKNIFTKNDTFTQMN